MKRPPNNKKPWFVKGIWPEQIGVRHAYNLVKNRIPRDSWTVVKGDAVAVVTGRLKGATGVVTKVMRRISSVVIEGVNLRQKKRLGPDGEAELYLEPQPVHRSQVNLIDPVTKVPVRVAIRTDKETGKQVRVTVGNASSNSVVPKPHYQQFYEVKASNGPNDTPLAEALKVTYCGDPAEDYLSWMRETAAWMAQVRAAADAERAAGTYQLQRGYITRQSRPHTGFGIRPDPPAPEVAAKSMLPMSKKQARWTQKNPFVSQVPVDERGSLVPPSVWRARRRFVFKMEVRQARMRKGQLRAGRIMGPRRKPHNRWWLAAGGTPVGTPVDAGSDAGPRRKVKPPV